MLPRAVAMGPHAAALAVALLCACGPSEERASDEQLRAAIERMRTDPSKAFTDRTLRIAEVEKIEARTPAGREAKDACVTAYRKLLSAEEAIGKAEQSMKMAEAVRGGEASAAAEVAAAEKLLDQAKLVMPACQTAAAKLALTAR